MNDNQSGSDGVIMMVVECDCEDECGKDRGGDGGEGGCHHDYCLKE